MKPLDMSPLIALFWKLYSKLFDDPSVDKGSRSGVGE